MSSYATAIHRQPWRLGVIAALTIACVHSARAAELPTLDCVIEPYEVVEVSSAAEGVIEKIHVERNELVTKDQVLAELESDVEKASLAFAHLNASLDTDIGLRRASLDFDERNSTRIKELYAKKAIPLHHKDEADTDAAKSKWLLTKAEDDKRLAALELVRAKAVVRRKTVRSPIDGVVTARHRSTGEYIEDQAIVTVAQLHPLRVEVIAPVELFGTIESGMSAKIFPELVSSGIHRATVVSVDRFIDGASGTFDVRLELPNPEYKIPSGLKCQVEFDDAAVEPVLETAAGPAPPASSEATDSNVALSIADIQPDELAAQDVTCNAVGPLANEAEVERVTKALRPLATRIKPAQQLETVIESYLVAAPLQATTAGTVAIQGQILGHNISGTELITDGEFQGQISFGSYPDKTLAERRRLDLQKLGFQVDLKPRLHQQPRIWLHVETADRELSEIHLLQAVASVHPAKDIDIAPCGYPSAGDGLALKK